MSCFVREPYELTQEVCVLLGMVTTDIHIFKNCTDFHNSKWVTFFLLFVFLLFEIGFYMAQTSFRLAF